MLIAQSKGPKRNFVVVILALGIETLVKMFQMEQKLFKGTKKSAREQKTCKGTKNVHREQIMFLLLNMKFIKIQLGKVLSSLADYG